MNELLFLRVLITWAQLEKNRKSHRILHDFFDRFINSRDSRALILAAEPDSIMEEKKNLHIEPGALESLVQLQQRDPEHVSLQHPDRGILGLSFLPISQLALVLEAPPSTPA